ncbi:hypothetical protein MMC25_000828 [Agyrium rufum]|nr:hypothetical protein [Agyrium rufum]
MVNWTPEVDAKMLFKIIQIQNAAIDWKQVAESMAGDHPGITIDSVKNRYKRLRTFSNQPTENNNNNNNNNNNSPGNDGVTGDSTPSAVGNGAGANNVKTPTKKGARAKVPKTPKTPKTTGGGGDGGLLAVASTNDEGSSKAVTSVKRKARTPKKSAPVIKDGDDGAESDVELELEASQAVIKKPRVRATPAKKAKSAAIVATTSDDQPDDVEEMVFEGGDDGNVNFILKSEPRDGSENSVKEEDSDEMERAVPDNEITGQAD